MTNPAGLDDDTLEMILNSFNTVAERRLGTEERLRLDAQHEFPLGLIKELVGPELGLHLLFIPEECGGLGGGARDLFRVSEEMARVDLAVATAFLAIALGVDPISVGGSEEQRLRWLSGVAEEGKIVAYGVTEPTAGSDVARLKTVATPVPGPDGSPQAYLINGTKQFITNGGVAQLYTILARTPGGPSFFVVTAGTPGLSAGPPELKHGIRASNTTQVILENVKVPADQLLGLEEGRGLDQANKVFGYTRLMVAAFGLGAGEESLARAIRYGQEREQFGGPLTAKQGYTHKLLVPHAVRLEAARAYCEDVAARLDGGQSGQQVEGAVAKYFATEAGNAAADAALQAHGGYGYMHEYEVEKIRRDVRITTIYEGTSETLLNVIGIHRWRMVVRSKGAFYRDMATSLRELAQDRADAGLGNAALAADAMAETLLLAHTRKLPRQQYAMFELARLVAEVETAVVLSTKAARVANAGGEGQELLLPCARLHAARAAYEVATCGLRLMRGCGLYSAEEVDGYRTSIDFEALLGATDSEFEDLNQVAAVLLGQDN